MQYFASGNEYIVVLKKGEALHASLTEFADKTGIKTAWLQGLGAALELEIGYYDLQQKTYVWKQLEGAHEITGMQGNISRSLEGEALLHIHGTFSDAECKAFGGHVNKLIVGGTCELLVKELPLELTRMQDEETGLRLLCAMPSKA